MTKIYTHQNTEAVIKAVLKGKFIDLNDYITNKNPRINDLRFFFL